jgi:hypothetical protein
MHRAPINAQVDMDIMKAHIVVLAMEIRHVPVMQDNMGIRLACVMKLVIHKLLVLVMVKRVTVIAHVLVTE